MFKKAVTSRWRRLAILLALAAGVATAVGPTATGSAPTAAFEWRMPDRLGQDANGDGIVDVRDTHAEIDPSSWRVNFDACDSAGSIAHYRWSIDGSFAAESTACDGFSHNFGSEGTYTVALTTVATDGSQTTVTKDVVVQDFLIIALGDSYGSGEGNPDKPIPGFAFNNFRDAGQHLNEKLAALGTAQHDFDATFAKAQAVFDRLSDVNHALADQARFCNPLSPDANVDACLAQASVVTNATARLLSALTDVGLQALVDSLGQITEAVDDLVAAAQATLDTAQAFVDDAQAAVDNAQAALSPTWQNKRCHRSAKSGQARAALAVEDADPHTSVTLVHLACSGGEILNGLLGEYGGIDPRDNAHKLPPQIEKALDLIGDREIDALVMSIGGNDANFGPIVEACIVLDPCHQPPTVVTSIAGFVSSLCAPFAFVLEACSGYWDDLGAKAPFSKSGEELRVQGAARLTGTHDRYDDLSDSLQEAFPRLPSNDVYITQYPNATEDDDGSICDLDPLDPLSAMPGLSPAESLWARDSVTLGLNGLVQSAASDHGWTFVGGVFDAFHGHGYCANDHWLNRFQDSFANQGGYEGAVHPNFAGHTVYKNKIRDALMADLFVGGDLNSPRRPQQPPTADARGPYVVDEGSTLKLSNGSFDRNDDALTFSWLLDRPFLGNASVSDVNVRTPILSGVDDAAGDLRLTASDAFASDVDHTTVTVRNVRPALAALANRLLTEGQTLSLSAGFSDPGVLDTHTASVNWGDGSPVQLLTPGAHTVSASHPYPNEGLYTVMVGVSDDDGGADTKSFTVTVANAPPVVGAVTATLDPVAIGTPVSASADFTDAGTLDTHTATWSWDDGTTSTGVVTESGGSGHVTGSRTFATPGVYEIAVTVKDDGGATASRSFQYVVVFDPSGGFATGAGQIDSPAGAYTADPTLAGKAHFGFVSRYEKGATKPSGRTDFDLKFATFEFGSDSYQWLVVAGTKAQYKGLGTLNGVGGYGFLLTARDGGTGPGSDSFRIKISAPTGQIVYDNVKGTSDDIDKSDLQTIKAGSIVIHK